MKTRDLVTRLAADLKPVEPGAVSQRLYRALVVGFSGSTALLVALYGIRSDMPQLILTTMFWARLAFPLAVVFSATRLAERLGRPGAQLSPAGLATALPVAAMLLATGGVLIATPSGYRLQLVLGTTWRTTVADVVLLSLPPLAAALHAMKRLAPTRLVLAGAGAGLLAGAQALIVYSLYCAEMSIPFWGVWYVLSLMLTVALGATLAPVSLRW
ncbi:hypothetical protein GQ56_0104240 [Burkholderia paludis]|uniref:DUF1109 domain-containing protein n=1 Tax=Burkholderia paludis TaxID=1506587 RepID=UPI0004DB5EE4|nr:DUF1109 domain-containing protein [Burkholderia paludis]KFG98275.1 hypothetical protein GQ56_0104240 [Burkholderia paludis]